MMLLSVSDIVTDWKKGATNPYQHICDRMKSGVCESSSHTTEESACSDEMLHCPNDITSMPMGIRVCLVDSCQRHLNKLAGAAEKLGSHKMLRV